MKKLLDALYWALGVTLLLALFMAPVFVPYLTQPRKSAEKEVLTVGFEEGFKEPILYIHLEEEAR